MPVPKYPPDRVIDVPSLLDHPRGAQTTPGIVLTGSSRMTPLDWADVPDNPRQRDTVRHAKHAPHLDKPHPAHAKVNMARLPDGRVFKLDGHTRSYKWSNGSLPAPEFLNVDIWDCATLEDVKELYTTFDNRLAAETAVDQLYGAVREVGATFQSDFLARCKYTSALRLAYEIINDITSWKANQHRETLSTYMMLNYWLEELELFDRMAPEQKMFPVGIAAAALLTLARYGSEAVPFWQAYIKGTGTKTVTERDPVQALTERIMAVRAQGRLSGAVHTLELCCICLSAFERHRRGGTYVGGTGSRSYGIKTMQKDALRAWASAAKTAKERRAKQGNRW